MATDTEDVLDQAESIQVLRATMSKYREKNALNQREMADQVGLTQAAISKLESANADSLPRLATLQKLCAGMGTGMTVAIDPSGRITLKTRR